MPGIQPWTASVRPFLQLAQAPYSLPKDAGPMIKSGAAEDPNAVASRALDGALSSP